MRRYPDKLNVHAGNGNVIRLIEQFRPQVYVEVGTYEGHTAHHVVQRLPAGAEVYLLDFEQKRDIINQNVGPVTPEEVSVYFCGNTDRTYDSYNWTLSLMLDEGIKVDFAYLDGAHTLAHDGLAFALLDRMLKPGGVICFDDYGWSIDTSISVASRVYDKTNEDYTEEQQKDLQVARVVRQLVRTRDDYDEIVRDFAFRKRN